MPLLLGILFSYFTQQFLIKYTVGIIIFYSNFFEQNMKLHCCCCCNFLIIVIATIYSWFRQREYFSYSTNSNLTFLLISLCLFRNSNISFILRVNIFITKFSQQISQTEENKLCILATNYIQATIAIKEIEHEVIINMYKIIS